MEDNIVGEVCYTQVNAVNDAMYVLGGKWKIPVLAALCYNDKRRFSDLLDDVQGISNKMLSKELKELEMNLLVVRTVLDTRPTTVEYRLSPYGKELTVIIQHLAAWGREHRKKITQQ